MSTSFIVALIVLMLFLVLRRFGGREEVVNGTRILVASLGREAEGWLEDKDAAVYSKFYRHVKVLKALGADALVNTVGRGGFDMVHLLCEVDADGYLVAGDASRLKGDDLLEACRTSDVKILFIAQDNPSEHYVQAFIGPDKRRGLGLNLILTMERKGELFGRFVGALLQRMSAGATMPVAWVDIAPQVPHPPPGIRQEEQPGLVFRADRGGVKLLP